MAKVTSWEDLPLVLGTRDVQKIVDVGGAKAREMMKAGLIPSFRAGRAYKIPRDGLRMALERLAVK